MSVTQVPLRPIARGSQLKYWLAVAALVLAAFLLARLGAGQLLPARLFASTALPAPEGPAV